MCSRAVSPSLLSDCKLISNQVDVGAECSRIHFFPSLSAFQKSASQAASSLRRRRKAGEAIGLAAASWAAGARAAPAWPHPVLAPACWWQERGTVETWLQRYRMRPETCQPRPCELPGLLCHQVVLQGIGPRAAPVLCGLLSRWALKPF